MKIGDVIYYYANLASGVYSAATVIRMHNPMLVDLTTWDGNQTVQKTSVHHKDSPIQQENNPLVLRQGAWSFRDEDEDAELLLSLERRPSFKKSVPAKV